ncbi:transposase [Brachymonas denitrificans]|uniref:transposase n=1 Tax=Brachymonas denitrificans TaxID=28220 RepID=UPI002AFF0CCA|nr:transposase [Brachymonas denitrificans]
MARLARLSVAGYPHHVIQRGNNRQAIFLDETDYERMLQLLREASARHRVGLHAWVLLPGQMQLLATPQDAEGLPRMMQDVGRAYVRTFNNRHLRSGTLWEGRYRNTVVDPDLLLHAMACLDSLPVREQLARSPEGYAWSSSAHYTGQRSERMVTPPTQIWQLGNTPFAREDAYRALLHEHESGHGCAQFQEAALGGWAHGSPDFVLQLQQLTGRRLQKSQAGRPARKVPEAG